jgi:cysteinyl-tRNA synthetase
MSLKYLGETLDIHGGGQDLIFPHHENELAQSENFTGVKPFVRYWLHNGLLRLGEEKMSKSLGNLITIKEALEKYSADALRIFVLGSHYRSPLTYSEAALAAAEGGAGRLLRVISRDANASSKGEPLDASPYHDRFVEAMDDDFNTPQALGILFDLARAINQAADAETGIKEAQKVLLELAGVLGLKLEATEEIGDYVERDKTDKEEIARTRGEKLRQILDNIESIATDPNKDIETIRGYVNLALGVREALRQDKNFQLADEIRDRLAGCGFVLNDTPAGTTWKYKK